MFLVQKFSCPVATHGHEPSEKRKKMGYVVDKGRKYDFSFWLWESSGVQILNVL
jgi:hypothetical protein